METEEGSIKEPPGVQGSEEKPKPIVEIKGVNKFYGENHVVKNLDLTIYEKEFLSILGPSGCGKTTILRMIAGFEHQTNGSITIEGDNVENKEPYERNINTVFQSYALFPHMTIYDNIAYGLKMKKVPKDEIKERVAKAISMVRLEGFDRRFPSQLSGGQKQRVAIARAIINNPHVLLLDEPLGALDMKLRKQMQIELKNLQRKLGITFVYVTHDQEEALTMSDRIAVMNVGILDQCGKPEEIYAHPATKFIADFIGETNLFEAVAEFEEDGIAHLYCEAGDLLGKSEGFDPNEMVYVSVRPEKTKWSSQPVDGFSLGGVVRESIYLGNIIKTIIMLTNGQAIRINSPVDCPVPPIGSVQYINWDIKDAVMIYTPTSNEVFNQLENMDLRGFNESEKPKEDGNDKL
ncbi:MAG: ABC transporter ATP-binding protein [Elusimicrobiota bacterium]|jgi:spermidine/putrescine transport system ATP-binding protein|nr:ABC transporter ATP-binding protein [Elusimicrobiota bacterium]